jgi:hypothetical protein
MTQRRKLDTQMNLALCQTPPIDLPADKQRELAAALADLLWNAAVEAEQPAVATGDEA